jgi:hypothetical protein
MEMEKMDHESCGYYHNNCSASFYQAGPSVVKNTCANKKEGVSFHLPPFVPIQYTVSLLEYGVVIDRPKTGG